MKQVWPTWWRRHLLSHAQCLLCRYFSLQATNPLGFGDSVRMEIESNICREGGPLPDCFTTPLRQAWTTMEKVVEHIRSRNPQDSQSMDYRISELKNKWEMKNKLSSLAVKCVYVLYEYIERCVLHSALVSSLLSRNVCCCLTCRSTCRASCLVTFTTSIWVTLSIQCGRMSLSGETLVPLQTAWPQTTTEAQMPQRGHKPR